MQRRDVPAVGIAGSSNGYLPPSEDATDAESGASSYGGTVEEDDDRDLPSDLVIVHIEMQNTSDSRELHVSLGIERVVTIDEDEPARVELEIVSDGDEIETKRHDLDGRGANRTNTIRPIATPERQTTFVQP